jgi:hypothetical protein
MPRRQLVVFTIGCWVTIATALLHLAGHLSGPAEPLDETGRQMLDLATNYRTPMPGGSSRSLMDFTTGLSLTMSVLLALTGGLGLIIRKRAGDDGPLMIAAARSMAAASVVMVVISLTYWFIVPSVCLAAMAVCFLVASVRPPG